MSENLSYFNYHLHTTYSNVSTIDSTNSVESMIIRAKELGQTAFTVSEHGNMISKYESASLCKDKKKGYNMKHICSVEAYFVKDRLAEIETDKIDKKTKLPTKVKDNTNAHMILIAKNYNGYKQLNTILSYANIDGFYSKARIDFDLINRYVNENDVIITTACVSGFVAKYGIEIIPEFQRFIDAGNFYIEFQAHNTDKQKEYNKIILDYAIEHNIPTTVACDTHIINENDDIFRDLLLRRKGIRYEEESGWTLDFPSGEELFYRFEIQNVVPADLIMESFRNTLKIAEECEAYDIIKYELKIPVAKIHRHLLPQERKDLLKKIVYDEFNDYKTRDAYANANESKYIEAIEYELGEIFGCETYDYFLLNYFIVKRAKELGGVLTKTSRGSAGCYIVNMLLHFTSMDRLQFDLPLLPERFMTKERLLLSMSAPDELTSSIIER